MATPTSPTAGDGSLGPNPLSWNDFDSIRAASSYIPPANRNSNLAPTRNCEFDALKAIMGNGCGKSGLGFNKSSALQAAVYSLVIFFISKRMFPKQAMGVMVGSLVLGVFSALAVTKLVDVSNRKK